MLINKNTRLVGNNVVLVPYRKEHVLKYHIWMQSAELQQLTASEPLTLQQEYEMQQSWMNDKDKCTFIILNKKKYEETQDEVEAMIGDTNLFFLNGEEPSMLAEAEIMIAEQWARGQRLGWEAIIIMLHYGITELNIKHYVVKISTDNESSLRLFHHLGFIETGRSVIFNEVTLEIVVQDRFTTWLSKMPYEKIEESG